MTDFISFSSPVPSPRFPNEIRGACDPAVTAKPLGGSTISSRPAMAGLSTTPRAEAQGLPRNSSIDSAISAMSSSSQSPKNLADGAGQTDIAGLIKAAGSPEAVIQYLLKDKQSQSQQNAQLWRLVDKQRAMILGLNKDLERALKDKEKYRKKLKEVVAAAPGVPPLPAAVASQDNRSGRCWQGRVAKRRVRCAQGAGCRGSSISNLRLGQPEAFARRHGHGPLSHHPAGRSATPASAGRG